MKNDNLKALNTLKKHLLAILNGNGLVNGGQNERLTQVVNRYFLKYLPGFRSIAKF